MKTNNKLTQWTTSSYNISDSLLTKNLLTQYINIFWNDLFSTLPIPIPLGQGQGQGQGTREWGSKGQGTGDKGKVSCRAISIEALAKTTPVT